MKLSAGSADYYLRYAADEGERPGEWMGQAAASLGLAGRVEPQAFRNLFAGIHPEASTPLIKHSAIGKQLGHAPGWDICFSCPKDVSAVWALFPELRDKIEKTLRESVTVALDFIEENLAFVRRGSGGKRLEPCKLIAAVFFHVTSRNNDPQLHAHVVILNVALEGERFGTINSKYLYDNQTVITRVFRAALANAIQQELGLEVTAVQPKPFEHGQAFNIRGVPDDLRKLMSSRRAEILTAMAERGDTSGRGSEAANLETRKAKSHRPLSVLEAQWKKAAVSIGVDLEAMKAALLKPHIAVRDEVASTLADAKAKIQGPKHPHATANVVELFKTESANHAIARDATAHILQAPQPAKLPNAVTTSILANLTRSAIANTLPDAVTDGLIDHALEFADRKQRRKVPASIATQVAEAQKALPDLMSTAKSLAELTRHTIPVEEIKNGVTGPLTSRDADTALVQVLSKTGHIACVDAPEGVDANLFVGAIAKEYDRAGLKVRPFTANATAASELETIVGNPVYTTGQLLWRMKSTPGEIFKHHAAQILRAAADLPTMERWQFDKNTVVVLTQAQSLKTVDLRRILSEVKAAGAKIIVVGSSDQRVRREPHNAFSQIVSAVGKVVLSASTVLSEEWMRDAVRQVSHADPRGALAQYALADKLHLAKDQRSAAVELAAFWQTLPKNEQNGKTLMIAANQREARALNALAQAHRKADGGLGRFLKQKVDGSWVRRGDRILFRIGSKHHGFRAGDIGTIEKIGLDGMRIRLDRTRKALLVNRTIRVTVPKNLYRGLTLGYAVSAADAQGMSCEKALVLPRAGGNDLQSLLIQLSRARGETRIFTTPRSVGEDVEAIAESFRLQSRSNTRQTHMTTEAARVPLQPKQEQLTIHTPPPPPPPKPKHSRGQTL